MANLADAARESLRLGDLEGALAQLKDAVRKQPADVKLRIFLFQFYCLRAEWERALTQLSVCGEMDPACLPMVQTYREAIRCEAFRSEVFAGKRTPLFLGEPPEWAGSLVESLKHLGQGQSKAAGELRDQAFAKADALSGTVDGQPFSWLADADTRLGPLFEAVVNGRYFWIPQANIARLDVEAPVDLRDRVWMPVHFTWRNGGDAPGLIPTRYPGSEASEDSAVVMARKTLWAEQSHGHSLGLGQRLLATDQGDYPLMDVRRIEFAAAQEGADA